MTIKTNKLVHTIWVFGGTHLIGCTIAISINLRLCRLLSAAIENTMNNRNSVVPIMESGTHWK